MFFIFPDKLSQAFHISTNTADWTTQKTSDDPTGHLLSNHELTHNATAPWEGPSEASLGSSSFPALTEKHLLVTEARTVQDIPVTDQRKRYADTDSTDSLSRTDSTYVSTTSRVGERTLLSVTSNSTSLYTNDSDTSETVSQTLSWEEGTSGATQGRVKNVSFVSTTVDQTELTSEDHSRTSGTQGQFTETEGARVSQGTESQTRQPFVTRQRFEQSENPNSTLPFTMTDNGKAETDVTYVSSETSYTETRDSVSSSPPFTTGEHNVSSSTQQNRETTVTDSMDTAASTEFSTGTVSSSSREEPKGPSTRTMEDTTVQVLTTAPPAFLDVSTTADDLFSRFSTRQPPIIPKSDDPTNTEVVSTSAVPATQRPQITQEATYETSTFNISTSTTVTAPVTTRQLQASTTPPAETELTTLATTNTVHMLETTASSTTKRLPTSPTGKTHAASTSGFADVTTLHLETSTATPGNMTAHDRHTTKPFTKITPTSGTVVFTTRSHTDKETTEMGVTTTHMPTRTTPSPGAFVLFIFDIQYQIVTP